MYTHHNLLPAKIASNAGCKPELKSLAFFGNRTIATDSFRLLEVGVVGDKEAHDPKLMYAGNIKATTIPKSTLKFELSDVESATGQMGNPHENYPDVDQIMNEDPDVEYATVKVDGKLLGELLMQMAKISKYDHVEMKVPVNRPYKAIHLYTHNCEAGDERQDAHGLMMPMNR